MPDPSCNRNERLDRGGYVRVGEAKIAVATLLAADEEACRLEFLEVPGRGGRGNGGLARKLGR